MSLDSSVSEILFFNVNGLISKGKVSDDGFVLIRKSEISKKQLLVSLEKLGSLERN